MYLSGIQVNPMPVLLNSSMFYLSDLDKLDNELNIPNYTERIIEKSLKPTNADMKFVPSR